MGEYAKYNGHEVKIGTCENMYYLRWDQRYKVTPLSRSVNPLGSEKVELRWRFPFPDEDSIAPGAFDDCGRGLWLYVNAPSGIQHSTIQLTSSHPRGYMVNIPCPENPDEPDPVTVHRNGFVGNCAIVQQKLIDDKLALIMQCACGAKWNYPTMADAEPVITHLLELSKNYQECDELSRSRFYLEVATRIREGYENPGLDHRTKDKDRQTGATRS